MAKPPRGPQGVDVPPNEFAQVAPRDLHPTSDIRFVMTEVAKLTTRVDGLVASFEKLSPTFEKAIDRHAGDTKERFVELKSEAKETREKLQDVKESIATFKGAMKIFGGLYALALIVFGAFLTWYLRPAPPTAPKNDGVATALPPSVGNVAAGTTAK